MSAKVVTSKVELEGSDDATAGATKRNATTGDADASPSSSSSVSASSSSSSASASDAAALDNNKKEDVEKTKRKTATRATEGGDQEGKASEEAESEIDRRVPTFIRKATTTSGVGWSGLLSAIMWNHAEKKYYVRNLSNKDRIQQVVQRPFCVTYFAYR